MCEYKINGTTYRHYAISGHCFKNGYPCEVSELSKALHDSRVAAMTGGVA